MSTPATPIINSGGVPLVELEINGKRARLRYGVGAWQRIGINPFQGESIGKYFTEIAPDTAFKFVEAALVNKEDFVDGEILENLDPLDAISVMKSIGEQIAARQKAMEGDSDKANPPKA